MTDEFTFKTIIDPPQVRIPLSLEGSPESKWYQGQASVLYQIWDALIKLGTSGSSIISDGDLAESFIVACSDETTFLTVGTSKATFRIPYNCEITDISASLTTAATGTTKLSVDIGVNGTSILITKLTFDSGDKTTVTASVPRVVSSATLSADDEIRIDILSIGNILPGTGLKVTIEVRAT